MLPLLGRPCSLAAAALLAGSLVCCTEGLPRTPSPAGGVSVLRGGVPAGGHLCGGGSGQETGSGLSKKGLQPDSPAATPDEEFMVAQTGLANGSLGRTAGENPTAAKQYLRSRKLDWHERQNRTLGWFGSTRAYDLFPRPGEDLSVQSLQEEWIFEPSDCLTFRHRAPVTFGEVPDIPGILGFVEVLLQFVPLFTWLLYLNRGRWNCAVCDLPRGDHPLKTQGEAEYAFREAMRDRDIPLAVRLIKGGLDCEEGSDNHELMTFLIANYCEDSFEAVRHLEPRADEMYEHLSGTPTPIYAHPHLLFRPFTEEMPFL